MTKPADRADSLRPDPAVPSVEHAFAAMMDILETAALIALVRRGGRAWHQYADVVETTGTALAVLRGDSSDEQGPLTLFENREPLDEPHVEAVVAELEGWRREGMQLLTVLDEA